MRVQEIINEYEAKLADLLEQLRQERMRVSLLNLANIQLHDRLAARDRALDLALIDANRWRGCRHNEFPRRIRRRDGSDAWAIDVADVRQEFDSPDDAADAAVFDQERSR